jgi:F-type H+-transporting ATPase subunit c
MMKSKWIMLPVLGALALMAFPAFAQEPGQMAAASDAWKGLVGLGAGLAMGLAVHGAGLGQGRLASSALEGMARNPQAAGKIQISMLLALAFPESLVLFSLVIAYMLQAKVI